jgi:hypothetical protein
MEHPSIDSSVGGSFNFSETLKQMQEATGQVVDKFLGVDWSQYPLIAILLVVIYFAQKFYREDRTQQDARLDRVLDGYQKALTNNTEALSALETTLNKERQPHG